MFHLAKETGTLDMEIGRLDEQLRSILLKVDFCVSGNTIGPLGRNYYNNFRLVAECVRRSNEK